MSSEEMKSISERANKKRLAHWACVTVKQCNRPKMPCKHGILGLLHCFTETASVSGSQRPVGFVITMRFHHREQTLFFEQGLSQTP